VRRDVRKKRELTHRGTIAPAIRHVNDAARKVCLVYSEPMSYVCRRCEESILMKMVSHAAFWWKVIHTGGLDIATEGRNPDPREGFLLDLVAYDG
jgi:hypothetical protein